jgi:hypothetical protein
MILALDGLFFPRGLAMAGAPNDIFLQSWPSRRSLSPLGIAPTDHK